MSTLRVTTLQNTSGVEVYTCKAWVNFNGTSTVSIRASGNVSSITDNGTGDYTVNFTNALTDANYSVSGSDIGSNQTNYYSTIYSSGNAPTASSFRFNLVHTTGVTADQNYIMLQVFR